MSIRVLVVDDQELVRTGFAMILNHQSDLEVVGEAPDGAQAVELTRALKPDVVLMDLRMPIMDGVEATRRIASMANEKPVRVLVLTTFDDDESVYAALRAGASGFMLKDVPARELAHSIRVVAAGQSLFAPSVTRRIIERFVERSATVDRDLQRRAQQLTEREQEVLRLVSTGLSNAQIADRLFLSEATIKSHVSHVLTKLVAKDRAQAVALAYEAGLISRGGSACE